MTGRPIAEGSPVSVRLPADMLAALRQKAAEEDVTLSDLMRRGGLKLLGICPTCKRPMPEETAAS